MPQYPATSTHDQTTLGQLQPRSQVDLVLSIVFMVMLAALTVITSYIALFSIMLTDSCFGDRCDQDRVALGMNVGLMGPWVVTAIGITVTIVCLVRRKVAFWIPIVAGILAVGVLWYGISIVEGAVS